MNQDIVPTHRAPRTSASDYVRGDQVQLWPSRMPSSSLDRCRGTCGARRPIMTTRSDPKRSDRSRWPRATPLDPPYAKKKKPSSLGASTTGIGHPSRRRGAMHRSWTPRAVSSHAPNPGKPTFPSLGFGRTRGGSSYGCRDRSPLTMSTRRADR